LFLLFYICEVKLAWRIFVKYKLARCKFVKSKVMETLVKRKRRVVVKRVVPVKRVADQRYHAATLAYFGICDEELGAFDGRQVKCNPQII
jgi:hypothetical protein